MCGTEIRMYIFKKPTNAKKSKSYVKIEKE